MELFKPYDGQELIAYMQACLEQVDGMTKTNRDLIERCLGLRIDKHSIWNHPEAIQLFRLETLLNDAMHGYFSNGIVSSEIILLLQQVESVTGVTVEALKALTSNAGWTRHASDETAWWIKRLFAAGLFDGNMYRGNAGQTLALLQILGWYAESAWQHVEGLKPAAECFLSLCRCVEDIVLPHLMSADAWTSLDRHQREHQRRFALLYPDATRPKHHHRLHLPQQYRRLGISVACWGVEASHRDYKAIFADALQHLLTNKDGGSAFSKSLLPRMLLRHFHMWNETPYLIKGYQLIDAYSAEEVQRASGVKECTVSGKCRFQMTRLQSEDIILYGESFQLGARILFFLEKKNQLYICMAALTLLDRGQCYRAFGNNNESSVVPFDTIHGFRTPSWKAHEDDRILCLL